nr:vegetative cell wall protein gp1-like [Drosophila takahashii]
MIQATSRPRNSLHCVPLQHYFTTGNGIINWMLNCTTGTETNVIIPLPENGTHPTVPGVNNNLNPCINTFPNHLTSDYLKYKYTGYPCYPLNPWKIGEEHRLPSPTGRITYPFPLLPELPVWSPPESFPSMNNLELSGLLSPPQAIGWPGPPIFPNPYPEPPAPILPPPGLAPPQPIPQWPAPPGPVIFPNPHPPPVWPPSQSHQLTNRWPSPYPHPGPPAPPDHLQFGLHLNLTYYPMDGLHHQDQ